MKEEKDTTATHSNEELQTPWNSIHPAQQALERELKIEAALEQVRARTMSMQKSEELKDIIQVVFDQFVYLNIDIEHTGFIIDYKEKDDMNIWLADRHEIPARVVIPYFDSPHWNSFIEAKQKGTDFFSNHFDFEGKNKFYKDLFELIPGLSEEAKEYYFSCPGLAISTVLLENIGLYIENFSGTSYTDEENSTLRRFGKVFQQTYTRFLDLQKAEAQARESQIQLALERVRARTMAMQHSDELKGAAALLFQQVKALGAPAYACGYNIWEKDAKEFTSWMSTQDGSEFNPALKIPLTEDANFIRFNESKERGEEFYVIEMRGERMKEHYQYLKTMPVFREYFEYAEKSGLQQPDTQIHHLVNFSHGNLLFITLDSCPGFHDVFKRFGFVFDQTYTRFLDLKKAEAQAREAQVEAALERVRSRTMAMQHSDELEVVALSLFQQVKELGIEAWAAGFNIWAADNGSYVDWITGPTGEFLEPYTVYVSHPVSKSVREAKVRGDDFFVSYIEGDQCREIYELLNSFANKGQFQKILDLGMQFPAQQYNHFVFGAQVSLMFITYEPCPEAWGIFKRFGKVFEQTYTRFLDLKKAEDQTRESKIQLGLERVRARTMAMQKSAELADAAYVLFQQFQLLGENPLQIAIGIMNETERVIEFSVTDWRGGGGQIDRVFKGSFDEPTLINKSYTAWKENKKSLVLDLQGPELEGWLNYRNKISDTNVRGEDTYGRRVVNFAFFSKGHLSFSTPEPRPEESILLLERFAGEFDMTYTRFLDLQKAEVQAREAQIEAALERVRSRAMAMQNSHELSDIVGTIFNELTRLHFSLDRCLIMIFDSKTNGSTWWLANPESGGGPVGVFVKYGGFKPYLDILNAWNRRILRWQYLLEGNDKREWDDFLFSETDLSLLPELVIDGMKSAERIYLNTSFNNFGCFIVSSFEPFQDENFEILLRFAKVFDSTYTRFNDLKQAETLARETIQRASVDRVRAEIASMRTTTDLERITPLIWNELTTIGVPFIRCGVFIMDEEQQQVNTFLSTPEGKGVAASFHLPYNASPETTEIVTHWNRKEMYRPHWDEAAFIDFTRALAERGAVTTGEKFLEESRPTDLYLHFIPFLQGMLYVGDTSPLSDNHLQLVQALAEAFSTAYARYEDFNNLETAKAQIEKTLTDLRQAQAQLVQSEKMASLGELTAGIAHEIQNPLNFVNNFSEINRELISEMKEELGLGKLKEASEIAIQIDDNEVKILHHGKRADAIVKGMLLHSQSGTGKREATDINALADEYLRLAFHGLRAKEKTFNAAMNTDYDESIGLIPLISQDIGRVLLNLYNNAFYAVHEKKKSMNGVYEPTVSLRTRRTGNEVEIRVRDNGKGIPQKIKDKIFQPFFTTKPTGQGTGLGLSLSYDIVKAHGGEIEVITTEGEFTEFIIHLKTD
jgi:signal transduction histidine kinase